MVYDVGKNNLSVNFDALEIYRKKLEQLGGGQAVKAAFDDALKDTQKLIAGKVTAAMTTHNKTGKVKSSIIKDDPVEWADDIASVNVGFDITTGGTYEGLPSIFLMYGTQLYGQPHIKPDRNLYNAVYGTATKREIKEIQETAFLKVLQRVMNE